MLPINESPGWRQSRTVGEETHQDPEISRKGAEVDPVQVELTEPMVYTFVGLLDHFICFQSSIFAHWLIEKKVT